MSDWIEFGVGREAAIDFGKMANISEGDTILFDGYTDSSSGYMLSTDGTKFRLPLNSLETVCSANETGLIISEYYYHIICHGTVMCFMILIIEAHLKIAQLNAGVNGIDCGLLSE